MSDSRSKSNEADWGLAGFDFTKLVESCQISGVDMMSLIDMEKQNIDALIEVNRSAYDSWRTLMAHQTEVFQETMKAIAAASGARVEFLGDARGKLREIQVAEGRVHDTLAPEFKLPVIEAQR